MGASSVFDLTALKQIDTGALLSAFCGPVVPFFQGVRLDLTKLQCKELWEHFNEQRWKTDESEEGGRIDSAFLRGKYDTWGESLLRTKKRSHRDVGRKWYSEVCERYLAKTSKTLDAD